MAYFETELAKLQAYTSGEASHDHAEISVRVEDHHVLPVFRILADIDVDLDVHLSCLSRDGYSFSRRCCDDIYHAQRKVVGATAVGLSAGYARARSKCTFDFFVSDGCMRTSDYKVYVSVVHFLRGFVGNVDVLE